MVIPLHTSTRRLHGLRVQARRAVGAVRERLDALAGTWRSAAERRQMADIDDRTLRDLGVHRSEIGSYFAEAVGESSLTRRRIADLIDANVGR
jgi:uncharacterized protein YjiS (DUF1127 family)